MSKFEKELISVLKDINASIRHLDGNLGIIVTQNTEVTKARCTLLEAANDLVSGFEAEIPKMIDAVINDMNKKPVSSDVLNNVPDKDEEEDEDDDFDTDEFDDDEEEEI